jgi:hypothetical protein
MACFLWSTSPSHRSQTEYPSGAGLPYICKSSATPKRGDKETVGSGSPECPRGCTVGKLDLHKHLLARSRQPRRLPDILFQSALLQSSRSYPGTGLYVGERNRMIERLECNPASLSRHGASRCRPGQTLFRSSRRHPAGLNRRIPSKQGRPVAVL